MNILTINVGSSSLKYALFENQRQITKGLIERIGMSTIKTHEQALRIVLARLTKKYISSLKDITVVAHRVVHGGDFRSSVVITPQVIEELKKVSGLAPLHEPFEIKGILLCKRLIGCTQIAVFDTSYFSSLPEKEFCWSHRRIHLCSTWPGLLRLPLNTQTPIRLGWGI